MNELNRRFSYFRDGLDIADQQPHAFTAAKELRDAIGDAVDTLAALARRRGMKPNNCDGVHNVEATIYEWLTKGSTFGAAVEGLGEFGDPRGRYAPGGAFERERAQLIKLGVVQP